MVTNIASDPDSPAQTLTFGLQAAPVGASISSSTGLLSWRPSMSQANSTYPIAVSVADSGAPSQSATQSFSVTVLPAAKPSLGSSTLSNGAFTMTVTGDTGPDYSIYTATDLVSQSWSLLLTTNPTSLPFLFKDSAASNSAQRFYRVLLGP